MICSTAPDCPILLNHGLACPSRPHFRGQGDRHKSVVVGGGLQKHGVKNKFEFLTFFETRQKGRNVNGCLPQPLYWISPMVGQGGARLAKNMQEHVFIDVPRPGNMLAVRGEYTRMRPCRQCHGNGSHESQTPPHPTKGCRQPGPKKVKNSVNFFRTQKWFCLRSQQCFFFHKNFSHSFSLCCQRFFAGFSRCFRTFFRIIFRTVFLAEFFARPFYTYF